MVYFEHYMVHFMQVKPFPQKAGCPSRANHSKETQMTRAAQILSGLMAVFVAFLAFQYLLRPVAISEINGFNPDTTFGVTNMRTLAAPMLMIAGLSAAAAIRQNWILLLPAALYFLLTAVIRVFGLIADGYDTSTLRGLVLAVVLFAVAEFALQVFRRAERRQADA